MNSRPFSTEITELDFGVLTGEEIHRLSVVKVSNPMSFDRLGNPLKNGLYDSRMGPFDRITNCSSCGSTWRNCPGHCGHVDLAVPCYNPIFFKMTQSLLKHKCMYCHHLRLPHLQIRLMETQLKLLDAGLLMEAQEASELDIPEQTPQDQPEGGGEIAASVDLVEEEFLQKLHRYNKKAKRVLKAHKGRPVASTRGLLEFRQQIINGIIPMKTCPHCLRTSPKIRTQNSIKIFREELRHAITLKNVNNGLGKYTLDVFSMSKKLDKTLKAEGEEMEEAPDGTDPEGQDVYKTISGNKSESGWFYMPALEVREHMRWLWRRHSSLFDLMFGSPKLGKSGMYSRVSAADQLFISVLQVLPTRYRMPNQFDGKAFDSELNTLLSTIVVTNATLLRLQLASSKKLLDILSGSSVGAFDPEQERASLSGEVAENVLEMAKQLEGLSQEERHSRILQTALSLQVAINAFIDSDIGTRNQQKTPGIRQLIEKKQGQIRRNLMGKRVNFAARSVISPDPYIGTDEIGIPLEFAQGLSFPEPVSEHNLDEMRRAVKNGPNNYPGANYIIEESGRITALRNLQPDRLETLSRSLVRVSPEEADNHDIGRVKIVGRHLINGDPLLANRQPTLHRNSIMAHKARVLPGARTVRMHFANCQSYNADFDGDEINLHAPQTYEARSEALNLMQNDRLYIPPTAASPIRGLIQDHVVAGVLLTKRDTFLTAEEFMDLSLIGCLTIDPDTPIDPVVPSVLFPKRLYTGKQVISQMLHHLTAKKPKFNLKGTTRVAPNLWPGDKQSQAFDGEVIVSQSELLTGLVEKNHLSASQGGLVHVVFELYGADIAGKLLTAIGRVMTRFLQYNGFTCKLEDLVVTNAGEKQRKKLLAEAQGNLVKSVRGFVGLDDDSASEKDSSTAAESMGTTHSQLESASFLRSVVERKLVKNPESSALLDSVCSGACNQVTSNVISATIPTQLSLPFPQNCLYLMTTSKAKGTQVNQSQIMCCLGQQALEGRRVPLMTSGRSLPCFTPFSLDPVAGGYIEDRFLTGLRPESFYFHCMAGREGLVDTAVKTANSGYLQRCLIKGMEGLCVAYDGTVRDSDGTLVQTLYGEDGIDVTKSSLLTDFEFAGRNYGPLIHRYQPANAASHLDVLSARKSWKHVDRERKAVEKALRRSRRSARKARRPESADTHKMITADPVIATMSPETHLGSTSEAFRDKLLEYVKNNPEGLLELAESHSSSRRHSSSKRAPHATKPTNTNAAFDSKLSKKFDIEHIRESRFKTLMNLRYLRSTVDPGEAVGVIAAESLGEPSTQLTLNTFHLAGHGAANVTLGIPRLREIIMSASSNFKKPVMTLSLPDTVRESQKLVSLERLASLLRETTLKQLVRRFTSTERVENDQRTYTVRVFLDDIEKCAPIGVTPELLRKSLLTDFLTKLGVLLTKEFRVSASAIRTFKENATEASEEDARSKSTGEINETLDLIKKMTGDQEEPAGEGDAEGEEDESESEDAGASASDEEPKDAKDPEEGADVQNALQEAALVEQRKENKLLLESFRERFAANFTSEERVLLARLPPGIFTNFKFEYFAPPGEAELQPTFTFVVRTSISSRRVLMISHLENVSDAVRVKSIKGVSGAFVDRRTKTLQTNGQNIYQIFHLPDGLVDCTRLISNDIHEMQNVFGIEAARALIIEEIHRVFSMYHIDVDRRHLTLVADQMTVTGQYRGLSRRGIASSASVLQKASFETSIKFFTEAALLGESERLENPSSRILVGSSFRQGTGAFDLLMTRPPPADSLEATPADSPEDIPEDD